MSHSRISVCCYILGKLFKYIDSKWQEVSNVDQFKLTKIEGQVTLTLLLHLFKHIYIYIYIYINQRSNILYSTNTDFYNRLVQQIFQYSIMTNPNGQ